MDNFQLVQNWPRLPQDFIMGNPTGLGIDSNQNVFVFHRAGREWPADNIMPAEKISSKTILQLDKDNGTVINSWGDNFFTLPHGLTVDKDDNIWVTDVGSHQVFKFSHNGALQMTLGEANIPGNDTGHFNAPTDVAVTKDGSFYVSDGYGNNRIVKFSATGQYLFEWGHKGDAAGEFNLPHAIELDGEENVYVADRENCRIQVFNSNGELLQQWADESFGTMSSIVFNKAGANFFAAEFFTAGFEPEKYVSDIISFTADGKFTRRSSLVNEELRGIDCWYHNIATDNRGDIYITDILQNRVQKLTALAY